MPVLPCIHRRSGDSDVFAFDVLLAANEPELVAGDDDAACVVGDDGFAGERDEVFLRENFGAVAIGFARELREVNTSGRQHVTELRHDELFGRKRVFGLCRVGGERQMVAD